jgi:hypothetical protein
MTVQGYDLVGDIHGHADALHRLLRGLDYAEIEGVFRHPERQINLRWRFHRSRPATAGGPANCALDLNLHVERAFNQSRKDTNGGAC